MSDLCKGIGTRIPNSSSYYRPLFKTCSENCPQFFSAGSTTNWLWSQGARVNSVINFAGVLSLSNQGSIETMLEGVYVYLLTLLLLNSIIEFEQVKFF